MGFDGGPGEKLFVQRSTGSRGIPRLGFIQEKEPDMVGIITAVKVVLIKECERSRRVGDSCCDDAERQAKRQQ